MNQNNVETFAQVRSANTNFAEGTREDDGPHSLHGFFNALSNEVTERSWSEHLSAVHGLPLDAVHLYHRSSFPTSSLDNEPETCAAIIKARHDLHITRRGGSRYIRESRETTLNNIKLMMGFQPIDPNSTLAETWEETMAELKADLNTMRMAA